MRFNNSQQKKEGKLTKLKDSDILIYDVEMKQFYKKINNAEEAKITKMSKDNQITFFNNHQLKMECLKMMILILPFPKYFFQVF